jgi:peptide/nickel transport system permease protein
MRRRLLRRPGTLAWLAVVVLVVLVSVFAPLLTPYDPVYGRIADALQGPSGAHWLGTDKLGRDVFARILFGGRVALGSGFEAVAIATVIGVPIGLVSGYLGGWFDRIVMRVVDGVMSVPFLVLAIALISVLGPGLTKSMAVVGVVYSMMMLRLTRGQTLAAREELYVDGARVTGAGAGRVLFRHILPNAMPPLIVQVTLMFATAIIAEATLSFLGLGIQAPQPSWGSMLADAQDSIRQDFFLAIPPGIAIVLTVLAFNQVGDGLRDLFSRDARGGSLGVRPVDRVEPAAAPPPEIAVADPLLRVRDLRVSFPAEDGDRVEVVQSVSFDVARGEILGLVGESGSGKSLSAMSVAGLVPDPGRAAASAIELDGRELTGMSFNELRGVRGGQVGVVFQEPIASLNPAYTVGDQVAEVLRQHQRISRAAARRRVVELFDRVHIPDAARRTRDYPHQFSGGMAQRVMIAMALACRPSLLIADEPTTALDVTVQGQVLDLLLELRDEAGMSILLITHDLGVVADVADRVAVMYAGQLVECGPTADVFARPAHPYTEGLLHSVPRNVARTGRLAAIAGIVPPPALWPAGCHFSGRCPYARDACTAGAVTLASAPGDAAGRAARCVRARELTLSGVAPLAEAEEPR